MRSVGALALVAGLACGPPNDPPPVYRIDLNPADDSVLAPHTGWTRAHYEALFGRLVLGWVAYRTPDGGRFMPPITGGWTQIEGISRMLPALGAWLANPENPAVIDVGDERIDLVELCRQTLVTLSDPEHPESWPQLRTGWFQGNVEAAYVAQFMVQARDRVWPTMTLKERNRLMEWLTAGNPRDENYSNNWNLFPTMRNVARARLDYTVDDAWTDEYLDQIEEDYAGDGWYDDGESEAIDWYNSFVLHPELLFWAIVEGERDPERTERIFRRSQAYLSHLPYFFAADGRAVPWGRSLAYRTAILSPMAFAIQAGISPNPPGLDRRIISGNLSYHMGGDPTSTDHMLNDVNVVTIGYVGEDFRVREGYISGGSPYFATRALQVLALPRDHEFWTAVEQPLPIEQGPFEHTMPGADLSVFSRGGDAPIHLWNGGNQKSDTTYSKLNYSTHFPFQRVLVDGNSPYDSALSVSPDGAAFWERGLMFQAAAAPGFVFNRSALEDNRGVLTQAGLNIGDLMIRLGCIDPGVAQDAHGVRLFEGSYPLGMDDTLEPAEGERDPPVVVHQSGGDEPWEYARSSAGNVMIAALAGFDMTMPAHAFMGRDDINFFHRRALQPAVSTRYPRADRQCVASLQLARLEVFDPAEVYGRVRDVELDEETRFARIGLDAGADGLGSLDAWVSLSPWTDPAVVEVAGVRFEGPLRYARVDRDGRRLVASGVRRIVAATDDRVLFEAEPTAGSGWAVEIDLDARTIITDVPGRFALDHGSPAVYGQQLGGQWLDRSAQIATEGTTLVLPDEVVAAHSTDIDLTTATFRWEYP